MQRIDDYTGRFINHVEALYRPGERALAIELAEALGCTISDTGFAEGEGDTFLAVHPDPVDRDMKNNAFYISEMTREHCLLEDALRKQVDQSANLRAMLDDYRGIARSRPFGIPHFGVRYRSLTEIEGALDAIERRLAPRLGDRIATRVYRRGSGPIAEGETVQAFVHQDVIVSGAFLLGQVMELQVQG